MALNIQKLKEFQLELEAREREHITNEVIGFLKSEFFEKNLIQKKSKKAEKPSPRVLNNWEKEGLVDSIDTNEGKFRTFNKFQAIWIEIVSELRKFGYGLEKIKLIRETLFEVGKMKFSKFEFGLIQSILGEPMLLIIDSNGKLDLFSLDYYKDVLHTLSPHLTFNLLKLAQSEFPNNKFDSLQNLNNLQNITENEMKLLYMIRTGEYESIKIRMSEGEVLLLEATEKVPIGEKISKIINQSKYQDIEIKMQNGEIVCIKRTEKIKV